MEIIAQKNKITISFNDDENAVVGVHVTEGNVVSLFSDDEMDELIDELETAVEENLTQELQEAADEEDTFFNDFEEDAEDLVDELETAVNDGLKNVLESAASKYEPSLQEQLENAARTQDPTLELKQRLENAARTF